MADNEDGASLLSTKSIRCSPDTITKLVMRVRALTFELLPIEVDLSSISGPSSPIVTPEVIQIYSDAAGDFRESLPYALLRARWMFVRDAHRNAADFDENICRATACEVLARRIVHSTPGDRLMSVMSARYSHRDRDGDISNASSALETAIDQNCTIFLSSNEAQHVVNSLWKGDWIQVDNGHGDIDYVLYNEGKQQENFGYLDPSRLGVPRYQSQLRIAIWFFFLAVYSQAVRTPLIGERQGIEPNRVFDVWEGLLYGMAFAFSLEEIHKVFVTLRFFTWRALGFWTVISAITDVLLLTAFVFRLMGIWVKDETKTDRYHLLSFQFLSCVAPFIWMKLITVFEGYKYIGTMTICIARMLQESVVFFALLSILLAGFAQGMYALDASDRASEGGLSAINLLLEGINQAPDFTKLPAGQFGRIMFHLWMLSSSVILLNILISLFSSAYQEVWAFDCPMTALRSRSLQVVDNAEAQYLAFFARKTVGMIRAPDTYVYPAPFNLVEAFFIVPFEFLTPTATYALINRVVLRTIFAGPLAVIALYESSRKQSPNRFLSQWIRSMEPEEQEDPEEFVDPQIDEDEEDGRQISRVPFDQLKKRLPNTVRSSEDSIVLEIHKLQKQLEAITKHLGGQTDEQ
ncbi:calcium activated cation channel [Auriculariales sp. MPI-PUGE-AT-0066]|nr:calcium activated cation channel [Auriculariales sp. MPI-PUGE-AT-0066]